MEIYNFADMQTDIDIFFETPYIYQDPYFAFFFLQYEYGLRFNEIKNSSKWIRLNDSWMKIPLSKNQDYRIINEDPEDIDYIEELIYDQNFITRANNSTASHIFNLSYPKKLYLNTGKSLTTHFFRHHKMKFLIEDGHDVEEVAEYFGEKSLLNVIGYVNSVIMY
jgi:site-specific recombinase XerD